MERNYDLEKRKYVIGGAVIVVVLVFLIRLLSLQIMSDDYKKNADSNALLKKIQYPSRGNIYDRNDNLLVFNQAAYDITVVMKEIASLDSLDLCETLGITPEFLRERFKEIKDRRRNPGYSPYTNQVFLTQLSAKECGVLRVVFHPDLDTLLGNYFDRLRFFVDGQGGFGEGVYVKAYVRDGFEGKVGNASPVLRMEKRDFDFGWVSAGDTVTVDFLLKNAGSNGLLIRKIETSCGCTVVEMDDRLVLPGQERRVRIKFDTQNLLGFQRKRIVLYTNDPKAGVVTLTLRGDVRK